MTDRKSWQTAVSINIPYFTEERMAELSKNGIHSVEMSGGNLCDFENFENTSKIMLEYAQQNGVCIRSVHLPFSPFGEIDPASTDAAVRDRFMKTQTELIKISAQIGVKIAVIHPSGEPYRPQEREEHIKLSLSAMAQLDLVAKQEGIILAVENLPRSCVLRNCEEISTFIKEIPDIHFVFDSNHSLADKNSNIIKTMGERIVATHISDYDFIDERHLLPGEGKNSWQEIMQCLEEVDYGGVWAYELRDCHLISAETIKKNHSALLSGIIK